MYLKSIQKNHTFVISCLLFILLQVATNHALADSVTAPYKAKVRASSVADKVSDPANGISDVYSDIDMRVRLASKTGTGACTAEQCAENIAFDTRVKSIGRYLSKAAQQLYPQQEQLIQRMVFSVAEKQEAGTASNNKGQVVVLRGVQNLQLSDEALGFVIAREMSHVMAGHHKTNTSTKLIISALASVLFPAIAIVGASSAAAQASTATTLLTSAASTATSMVGSEVALAQMKPTQLNQADEMALAMMEKIEWDMRHVESVLTKDDAPKSAWMLDLQASRATLQTIIEKQDAEIVLLEDDSQALPEVVADEMLEDVAENTEQVATEEVVIIPLDDTNFLADIPATQ
jgi:hypothetical protein